MFTAMGYNSNGFAKISSIDHNATAKKKAMYAKVANKNLKYSDEQILRIRSMYQFEGIHPKRILQAFPELDLTEIYLYKILMYETRSKLIPIDPRK